MSSNISCNVLLLDMCHSDQVLAEKSIEIISQKSVPIVAHNEV